MVPLEENTITWLNWHEQIYEESLQKKITIQNQEFAEKVQYMWQIDNQSVYSPFSVCGYVIVVPFENLDM